MGKGAIRRKRDADYATRRNANATRSALRQIRADARAWCQEGMNNRSADRVRSTLGPFLDRRRDQVHRQANGGHLVGDRRILLEYRVQRVACRRLIHRPGTARTLREASRARRPWRQAGTAAHGGLRLLLHLRDVRSLIGVVGGAVVVVGDLARARRGDADEQPLMNIFTGSRSRTVSSLKSRFSRKTLVTNSGSSGFVKTRSLPNTACRHPASRGRCRRRTAAP